MCDNNRYFIPTFEKYVEVVNMFNCFQEEENKIYPI